MPVSSSRSAFRSLPLYHTSFNPDGPAERGAGNETRTRDTKLGKLVLYQLSYARLPAYQNGFLRQKYRNVNYYIAFVIIILL